MNIVSFYTHVSLSMLQNIDDGSNVLNVTINFLTIFSKTMSIFPERHKQRRQ